MTVAVSTWKAGPYVGNGSATSFTFDFKCLAKEDLRVVYSVTATGVESDLVLDSDYTVALNPDQETDPGGSVTYPISGTPLGSAHKLTIVSNVAVEQSTDITNLGGFYPQVVENALDKTTILIAQMQETLSRAAIVGVSSGVNPLELVNDLITSSADVAAAAATATAAAAAASDSETNAAASEAYVASVANDIEGFVDTAVQDALNAGFVTPPQFDNDTSPVTSAFVQRALGNLSGIDYPSGAQGTRTLTAAYAGKMIGLTANNDTITLPLGSTLAAGVQFMFWNGNTGGGGTIQAQSPNQIYLAGTTLSAISVNGGESLTLVWSGSAWFAISGSVTLSAASKTFGSTLTSNGNGKLPGWMVQWGAGTSAANPGATITFPLAFPNACFSVAVSSGQIGTGSNCSNVAIPSANITATNFKAVGLNTDGASHALPFKYIAIGW
jgi:hypothetical protein